MKNRKVVAVVIWSVVAALLAGGLAYFGGLLDRVRGVAAVVEPDHAEREAVRAWLRENTDSGKWEEVRWWRFVDYEGQAATGRRVVRLKYRTHSGIAGVVLVDSVFSLSNDGKAHAEEWPLLKAKFPE